LFRPGQTFLYPLADTKKPHLWIIATAPNEEDLFAVVSLTSLKGAKDQTIVLRAMEHPFLRWDTCVTYALADISNCVTLQTFLDGGLAKMHKDCTPDLLALVLDGFAASPYTKKRVREFVQVYRLVNKS
jgi:hypothetical protein